MSQDRRSSTPVSVQLVVLELRSTVVAVCYVENLDRSIFYLFYCVSRTPSQ